MNPLKKLAGQTVVYGLSSIVGRLLNWLLVPFYTIIFIQSEYGVVSTLMAYVATCLVILTYGMETGYFRFANDSKYKTSIFDTSFICLFFTSSIFVALSLFYRSNLYDFLEIKSGSYYLELLILTVAMDAITSLPFARLRQEKKASRFAIIKLVNIIINLGINLFFLLLCPYINTHYPAINIQAIWDPNLGIAYIFIAYFVASLSNIVLLLPQIKDIKIKINFSLLKRILKYSYPIFIVGLAGVLNVNFDKIAMPKLISANLDPMGQTGIYAANYKLGVLMTLFIQAFRFAFEPFFFSQGKNSKSKELYADVLKYFVIFGIVIFLSVMFSIDLVKLIIDSSYHAGLVVVPYILLANLCLGIFFTLSLWYKLTDNTIYGAYLALVGLVITISLNIYLVPLLAYQGAAYAALACFSSMMLISYIWGQRVYPIPYDLKSILLYVFIAVLIYNVGLEISFKQVLLTVLCRMILVLIFLCLVIVKENKHKKIISFFVKKCF